MVSERPGHPRRGWSVSRRSEQSLTSRVSRTVLPRKDDQMPNASEKLVAKLTDNINGWIDELGSLLVPPFSEELQATALLDQIRQKLAVDAAALFLTPEDDPNQLRFVSGVGYKNEYRDTKYFLKTPALTSHVFNTKRAINMSAKTAHHCTKELGKNW